MDGRSRRALSLDVDGRAVLVGGLEAGISRFGSAGDGARHSSICANVDAPSPDSSPAKR